MAARQRYTDVVGQLGSGGLTSGATSHTLDAALTYANGVTVPSLGANEHFLFSILDVSGNVLEVIKATAYNSGTKAMTIERAQEGTSAAARAGSLKLAFSAYPSDFQSGILAALTYSGGTTVSTTSSTIADIDATNLAIAFVVPPSGKVLVTLNGFLTGPNGGSTYNWGLREGATTIVDTIVQFNTGTGQWRQTLAVVITGLTPGASKTYKWAHRMSFGSISTGLNCGEVVTMVVEAVA